MSRADTNNDKNKKMPIWLGIIFTLIGVGMIVFSIFCMTTYDKVEGVLDVRENKVNGKKNIKAYVTYEYNDDVYKDIGLDSYNAFTMKDGKTYTVYVNPNNPDAPASTNFALGVLFVAVGAVCIVVMMKAKNKD